MNTPISAFSSIMPITSRPPLVFERGTGSYLFDTAGQRYLDWVQGWAVNCLGHAPPALADALARQAATLINPSPAFSCYEFDTGQQIAASIAALLMAASPGPPPVRAQDAGSPPASLATAS